MKNFFQSAYGTEKVSRFIFLEETGGETLPASFTAEDGNTDAARQQAEFRAMMDKIPEKYRDVARDYLTRTAELHDFDNESGLDGHEAGNFLDAMEGRANLIASSETVARALDKFGDNIEDILRVIVTLETEQVDRFLDSGLEQNLSPDKLVARARAINILNTRLETMKAQTAARDLGNYIAGRNIPPRGTPEYEEVMRQHAIRHGVLERNNDEDGSYPDMSLEEIEQALFEKRHAHRAPVYRHATETLDLMLNNRTDEGTVLRVAQELQGNAGEPTRIALDAYGANPADRETAGENTLSDEQIRNTETFLQTIEGYKPDLLADALAVREAIRANDLNTTKTALEKVVSEALDTVSGWNLSTDKYMNDDGEWITFSAEAIMNDPNAMIQALRELNDTTSASRETSKRTREGLKTAREAGGELSERENSILDSYKAALEADGASNEASQKFDEMVQMVKRIDPIYAERMLANRATMIDNMAKDMTFMKVLDADISANGSEGLGSLLAIYDDMKGLYGTFNFTDENAAIAREVMIFAASMMIPFGAIINVAGRAVGGAARLAIRGATRTKVVQGSGSRLASMMPTRGTGLVDDAGRVVANGTPGREALMAVQNSVTRAKGGKAAADAIAAGEKIEDVLRIAGQRNITLKGILEAAEGNAAALTAIRTNMVKYVAAAGDDVAALRQLVVTAGDDAAAIGVIRGNMAKFAAAAGDDVAQINRLMVLAGDDAAAIATLRTQLGEIVKASEGAAAQLIAQGAKVDEVYLAVMAQGGKVDDVLAAVKAAGASVDDAAVAIIAKGGKIDDVFVAVKNTEGNINALAARMVQQGKNVDEVLAGVKAARASVDDAAAAIIAKGGKIDDVFVAVKNTEGNINALAARVAQQGKNIDEVLAGVKAARASVDDAAAAIIAKGGKVDEVLAAAKTAGSAVDDVLAKAITQGAKIDDVLAAAKTVGSAADDVLAKAIANGAKVEDVLAAAKTVGAAVDDVLAKAIAQGTKLERIIQGAAVSERQLAIKALIESKGSLQQAIKNMDNPAILFRYADDAGDFSHVLRQFALTDDALAKLPQQLSALGEREAFLARVAKMPHGPLRTRVDEIFGMRTLARVESNALKARLGNALSGPYEKLMEGTSAILQGSLRRNIDGALTKLENRNLPGLNRLLKDLRFQLQGQAAKAAPLWEGLIARVTATLPADARAIALRGVPATLAVAAVHEATPAVADTERRDEEEIIAPVETDKENERPKFDNVDALIEGLTLDHMAHPKTRGEVLAILAKYQAEYNQGDWVKIGLEIAKVFGVEEGFETSKEEIYADGSKLRAFGAKVQEIINHANEFKPDINRDGKVGRQSLIDLETAIQARAADLALSGEGITEETVAARRTELEAIAKIEDPNERNIKFAQALGFQVPEGEAGQAAARRVVDQMARTVGFDPSEGLTPATMEKVLDHNWSLTPIRALTTNDFSSLSDAENTQIKEVLQGNADRAERTGKIAEAFGFSLSKGPDGKYHYNTEARNFVEDLQKALGFEGGDVDGVLGPKTLGALREKDLRTLTIGS